MISPPKTHTYQVDLKWTGNVGLGTATYQAYDRAHKITGAGKPPILGSSDPAFRGDSTRYNPEELLVASLSACHLLWYLHLCAQAGIVVLDYMDAPLGTMIETEDGRGHFTEVILKPKVTVTADSNLALAEQLHAQAHQLCFIANSMNFPVRWEASIQTQEVI